jgi:hypothetical protein
VHESHHQWHPDAMQEKSSLRQQKNELFSGRL